MTAWRVALSLQQLRNELDARWPDRDKASDGTIGDPSHAASASDHNPNADGVVCAYDIDTDLDGTDDSNDPQMIELVETMRLHPHPNLKYVIYDHRVFRVYDKPGIPAFTWTQYWGIDPHLSHAHISVGVGSDGHSAPGTYDDVTEWQIAPIPSHPEEEMNTANLTTGDGHLHIFGTAGGKLFENIYISDGSPPGWVQNDLGALLPGAHGLSAGLGVGGRIDIVYVDGTGQMYQGFKQADDVAVAWTGQPPGKWD